LNSIPYEQSTRGGFACFTTPVCACAEDDAETRHEELKHDTWRLIYE